MNWLALLPQLLGFIVQLGNLIPSIIKAWDSAPSGGIQAVNNVLQGTALANVLAEIGSTLFPNLSPELHAAAAALVVAHPNNTSWAQSALNLVESTGYINFGPALVVDGVWGPKTSAAVAALQTKLGMPVNGFMADAEYNVLSALIAQIGGVKVPAVPAAPAA